MEKLCKLDREMLGETVKDITKEIKSCMPQYIHQCLDDLIQLHREMWEVETHPLTERDMDKFDSSFRNLCDFVKKNKVLPGEDFLSYLERSYPGVKVVRNVQI